MTVRLLLVDDHTMFRQGVARLFAEHPDYEVVGEADDGQEGVELVKQLKPDVVLMDVHMPLMDGVRATKTIMTLPKPPIIILLTMAHQLDYVFEGIRSGARGYFMKSADFSELVEAIEEAWDGQSILSPELTQRVLQMYRNLSNNHHGSFESRQLDEREIDILRGVASGLTNQEIGEQLGLSEKTIKNQLAQLFNKLNLRNRTEAAIYAIQTGLVAVEEL
jgi:NarL family two-component system response regulator LiaR